MITVNPSDTIVRSSTAAIQSPEQKGLTAIYRLKYNPYTNTKSIHREMDIVCWYLWNTDIQETYLAAANHGFAEAAARATILLYTMCREGENYHTPIAMLCSYKCSPRNRRTVDKEEIIVCHIYSKYFGHQTMQPASLTYLKHTSSPDEVLREKLRLYGLFVVACSLCNLEAWPDEDEGNCQASWRVLYTIRSVIGNTLSSDPIVKPIEKHDTELTVEYESVKYIFAI
ncbi:hypothetical protein GQ42DRAFT_160770 [Ramicandelaber brevisporus]|nr:hypothetical protein GQ42DRAFT_160770 [Ramicandelaber brevisporus]